MTYGFYQGTKQPSFVDVTRAELPSQINLGIYKGLVREIDVELRNGTIYVYIPGLGNSPDERNFWTRVSYASPFFGSSELKSPTDNSVTFDTTSQTYGFTVPCPDVGSTVLCCFPGGRKEDGGYWFACIDSRISKNMTPGVGALSADKIATSSVPKSLFNLIDKANSYPAGEINEANKDVFKTDWYEDNLRPLHIPRTIQLFNQGLDADQERGAIASSMQKNAQNTVLGFSTAGRNVIDREPWQDKFVKDSIIKGTLDDAKADEYFKLPKLGGHSILLDDGDFEGNNNLVRIRSSAGHQIIMNDSDGFMYICTASGNSWIELTKSGEMLIYNAGDISVRSQNNIMFHADENFMINAKKIQMFAKEEIKLQSLNISLGAESFLNLYGRSAQLKGGTVGINGNSNTAISSGGKVVVAGQTIYLNSGQSTPVSPAPTALRSYSLLDAVAVSIKDPELAKYTLDKSPNVYFWEQEPSSTLKSIIYKVPTHEPYDRNQRPNASGTQTSNLRTRSFSAYTGGANVDEIAARNAGVARALREPLNQSKKAPLSTFIKEASNYPAASGIPPLTRDGMTAYKAQIGHSESTSRYDISNTAGYQGKYQLGSAALQDLGLVKPGTPQTQEALNNPNNWVGGEGKPANLQEFLNSPETQEKAMQDYTQKNSDRLRSLGLIDNQTPPEVASGYLAASHLGGPGNVAKWASGGMNAADSNGTTLSTYFNLGRSAAAQEPTIVASLQSKPS